MSNLSFLLEELLNENPNQAIKFLKENGLDPITNPTGKMILDRILDITGGDGYTYLLTKFNLKEKMPVQDLRRLHDQLKSKKNILTGLPKPVVEYDTYRNLINDINKLESKIILDWLLKQLSPQLRDAAINAPYQTRHELFQIANDFRMLKQEKRRFFMKKVFGFKSLETFMESIKRYIIEANNENDYESTKSKIVSTPNANLVYDNSDTGILIAHIDSFDAMKTLGCSSAWCISKDMVRYRQYKTGGKQYFMIWDYNYPMDNPNFFIATAYSIENPNSSATHEHLNDKPLKLIDVLNSKKIDKNILNNYIEKYKENLLNQKSLANPFLAALQSEDDNEIVNMMKQSEYLKKLGGSPSSNSWRGEISLGISKEQLVELLELGDEFDYVSSTASYNYADYYDSSEANYMHSGLNEENVNLVKDLAKRLGVKKEKYKYFDTKEEEIRKFLDKYKLDELSDLYVSEYADAQARSEQQAAQELIDKIPFNVDYATFTSEKMSNYYIENELTAKTFDELIDQIKQNLPAFSYEELNDARYVDLDLDDLNSRFKEKIEEIIYEIETDEDSPNYQKARTIADSLEYLEKLGFKKTKDGNEFAQLVTSQVKIVIDDVYSEKQDDDSYQIMVIASIFPRGKNIGDKKKIRIPLQSIVKYIDQPELSLQEHLKRFKNLIK